jgi:hypothetical protein
VNALPDFTKRQAELFAIKCTEFADRVAAGRIALLDAVDLLHDAAVSSGLVEAIGDDAVQALAHGKRSVPERASIAADLHLNRVELISPTVKQCAHLAGVCASYVAAAVAIVDDQAAREAVLAGDCTLLDAAKAVAPETLAEHFARSTPKEWREAARAIGPALVWDHMIAPLV